MSSTLSLSTFSGARVQAARQAPAKARTAAAVRCSASKDVSRRGMLAGAVFLPALLPSAARALSSEDFKSPGLTDAQKEKLAKLKSPGGAGGGNPGATIPSLPSPPDSMKAPPKKTE